jgi:hypothetical protein
VREVCSIDRSVRLICVTFDLLEQCDLVDPRRTDPI